LRAAGVCVDVLSSGGELSEKLASEGIGRHLFPADRAIVGHLTLSRLRHLCERERYDILHAHARIPASMIRFCRRWIGSPAPVVTVHAAYSPLSLTSELSYWGEQTIAVGEDLRVLLSDGFGVPSERITVIPNGIDLDRFYPPKTPPPPRSLLFASRLDRDCSLGAELLCDLAPDLGEAYSDLTVQIAGGGNQLSKFQRRAKEINARFGGRALLKVLGHVEDMSELYRKNTVFVGVSRAAMEAALCGCAVILCGNEGYAGILTPQNPLPSLSNFCCRGYQKPTKQSLWEALDRLLSDGVKRKYTAMAGERWMRDGFGMEGMVERTLAVYRRVL
jgi:glycosyltransferase involved in cell wall biosynthesis